MKKWWFCLSHEYDYDRFIFWRFHSIRRKNALNFINEDLNYIDHRFIENYLLFFKILISMFNELISL
jgi:hypothetical protein